jgi:hypothetical protein
LVSTVSDPLCSGSNSHFDNWADMSSLIRLLGG